MNRHADLPQRSQPWMLSAGQLTQAYRSGALSPVEALRSVLRRLDAVNPVLNAVVTVAGPEAMARALQSAQRWRDGCPLSPLDGVPFTVKDNIPAAGMRSTFGSRLLAEHVPQRDELPVARLRAAGAILVGKTNLPEFALHGYTRNALFGTTGNPWDPSRTPGGSSGGAAAAVAAGIAPLAIATDGGGSIRRPCAHNGVAGLKPSTGRVPRTHGFPVFLHDFEVVGPIARSVADLALAMQVISPADTGDSRSHLFLQRPFDIQAGPPAPTRIRVLTALDDAPVDRETREQVLRAAGVFAALGHEVRTGIEEDLAAVVETIRAINAEAWPTISQAGLAWLIEHCYPGRDAELTPEVAMLLAGGRALPASAYPHALHRIRQLRERLATLFTRADYLLLPSAAAQPWSAGLAHPETIDGRPVGPRGHAIFTAFVNAAGLPALALPAGMSCAGLPIGLQLVGSFGADAALCALGMDFEQAAPWPLLSAVPGSGHDRPGSSSGPASSSSPASTNGAGPGTQSA